MKKSSSNPLKTVITISTGFILIFIITGWQWALYLSFLIGLTGMFSSWLSKKIEFLWMKLAWLLGLIIPNIILGLIFYLFLFPVSLLSKVFGKKDPLMLRNPSGSLYHETNKIFPASSFEKPW